MKKNFIVYIVSLIFAVFLWLYLTFNIFFTITLTVPVRVANSKTQILSNEIPEQLNVNLRAKGWDLLSLLYFKDPVYNLDISNLRRDTRIYTTQGISEKLSLPPDVTVLSIQPDTITVQFDNALARSVPVRNNLDIVLKPGYQIVGIPVITPDSVAVSGAASLISRIKYVSTEKRKFDNVSSDIRVDVRLIDTLGRSLQIEPSIVTVYYKIELAAEKEFTDIDIEILNVPQDREVLLIPPKINLSLRGGVEQLSKLTPQDVRAVIDFTDIEKDTLGYMVPEINLPQKFQIISTAPDRFQYIIKRKE